MSSRGMGDCVSVLLLLISKYSLWPDRDMRFLAVQEVNRDKMSNRKKFLLFYGDGARRDLTADEKVGAGRASASGGNRWILPVCDF